MSSIIVLIDTWWNVNPFKLITLITLKARFNRYMVECKSAIVARSSIAASCVLIDTWWNVNSLDDLLKEDKKKVLIDTWWNVNIRVC